MNKKRYQKGEMLIETVVAMAVFLLMATVFFSVYKSFSYANRREAAYIFFESECLSIDSYYDSLGFNKDTGDDYWAQDFFGNFYHRATSYEIDELDTSEEARVTGYQIGYQKYNSSLEKVYYDNPDYKYTLIFMYTPDGMVLNVEDKEDGYYVIKDLNYGPSEADSVKDIDYINAIAEKNVGIRKLQPDEKRYIEDEVTGD